MKVEVFTANSGELSKREDIEVDTVGHGLGVCLIEGRENYLCLADGGTFPKAQLVRHMTIHSCQKVRNEVICKTCHRVAGCGAVPAKMHNESPKHADIVRKLEMNVCLDCLVLCNDSHKCTQNVRKLADVQRRAGMKTDIREYRPSSEYKTHLVKTSYGSGQDDKSVDYMVTMICMSGKIVGGSKDATLPPLCEVHLGRMHISPKRAYANISIVEGSSDAKCKACSNARRITNGPEPEAARAYYVMTNKSNLKYPYAHKVLDKVDKGLKDDISPQEFGDLSDAAKKNYAFHSSTYRFVLVVNDSDRRDYVERDTEYHDQYTDPQDAFTSDDDEPPQKHRHNAEQQGSRTESKSAEAAGPSQRNTGKKDFTVFAASPLLQILAVNEQSDNTDGAKGNANKDGATSNGGSRPDDVKQTKGNLPVLGIRNESPPPTPKTAADAIVHESKSSPPPSPGEKEKVNLKGSRSSLVDTGAKPKGVIRKCMIEKCKRTLTGDNVFCAQHRGSAPSLDKQTS